MRDCKTLKPRIMCNNSEPIKPIFRWAGSKRRLIPTLCRLSPFFFDRYIEPFVGSGCLFFATRPKKAILGDINDDLIHAYRTIRDMPESLADSLSLMPISAHYYYDLRAKLPSDLSPLERAARFIYLNRYCFNGVYRTNRNGQFNVPRGNKTGNLPGLTDLRAVSASLNNVSLFPGDFTRCVESVNEGDFVYLDPPYQRPFGRDRGEYGTGSFCNTDIPRFLSAIQRLNDKGAKVLVSYTELDSLRELIDLGWQMKMIEVKRSVAGFACNRRNVREIILTNYDLSVTRGGCN